MKSCPKCFLRHEDEVEVCDCGYQMASIVSKTEHAKSSFYSSKEFGRYDDAAAVTESIVNYGEFIKVIGFVVGIIISIGSLAFLKEQIYFSVFGIITGIVTGGVVYSIGVLICANGQMLIAVIDTAKNTAAIRDAVNSFKKN